MNDKMDLILNNNQNDPRECGDSVVERQLRSERSGIRNLSPPCCVLEQDTLLHKSTGNTQEAVAPSLDCDVKHQCKQTKE